MTIPKSIKKTQGRISLTKRIKMKCLGCAGNSKEITLCHLVDCPLWAVRFGYPQNNKQYKQRMKRAETYYAEDFKELKRQGIDIKDFYKEWPISAFPESG